MGAFVQKCGFEFIIVQARKRTGGNDGDRPKDLDEQAQRQYVCAFADREADPVRDLRQTRRRLVRCSE